MNGPRKITVREAAKIMGKSTLFVREGMRRGILPIGTVIQLPGSQKCTFYISPPLLAAYIGAELPPKEEV